MLARLEDAQGRLRATLAEQRRFAADASHEMRTPLTALRGNIETLRRHDLPPAERAAMLADMATSVERMDRLVEGLLGLARVDGVPGGPSAWTWARWSPRSPPARSATAWSPGVAVTGDRAALRGMLMNLIDNGRRHGGRVTVAVAPRTARPWWRWPTTAPASPAPTASGSSTASTAPPTGAARPAPASACRSPGPPPSAGAAP